MAYDASDVLHLYYWSQDIGTQVKKYNGSSFVDASTGSLSGSYFHMRLDPYSDLLWFAPLESSKMMQLDGNNYTEVSSDLIFTGASFTAPRLAFDSINHIAYVAAIENGVNSVKIKMYDQEPFTSVNFIEQSNMVWNIFPNPSAGEINIEIQEGNQHLDLYLINDLGQTVQSWNFRDVEKIHVSIEAEKGIYILKAVTENGQSSKSLIVE